MTAKQSSVARKNFVIRQQMISQISMNKIPTNLSEKQRAVHQSSFSNCFCGLLKEQNVVKPRLIVSSNTCQKKSNWLGISNNQSKTFAGGAQNRKSPLPFKTSILKSFRKITGGFQCIRLLREKSLEKHQNKTSKFQATSQHTSR